MADRVKQVKPRLHPRDLQGNLEMLRDADKLLDARQPLVASSGVYLLFDGDEVVYVGQSTDLMRRILAHQYNRAMQFDSYVALRLPAENISYYEAMTIRHHRPRYNLAMPLLPAETARRKRSKNKKLEKTPDFPTPMLEKPSDPIAQQDRAAVS